MARNGGYRKLNGRNIESGMLDEERKREKGQSSESAVVGRAAGLVLDRQPRCAVGGMSFAGSAYAPMGCPERS